MNTPYSMGRLYSEDVRDKNYPISEVLEMMPRSTARKRFWFSNGWWGNQGATSHCVAYSWAHWISDGPLASSIYYVKPVDTLALYCEAQKHDPWPGDCSTPLYDGTSVRAGAKVLKDWGHIEEYRWASNVDEVVSTLLTEGPVVLGTTWREAMFYPDRDGVIRPTGSFAGGHAYLANGVDLDKGLIRIKNSWGKGWGKGGHAYMHLEDVDALIKDFGEACVPRQKRLVK